jgi:hypothetical protein
MSDLVEDDEIERLVQEVKPLPIDYRARMRTKPKHGHNEAELEVKGEDGGEFVIIARESQFNRSLFSAILAVRPAGTLNLFRLRRYNGQGHDHPNRIERELVKGPHIHLATERYQARGFKEDGFAIATDRYTDLDGAIACLLQDCGFVTASPPDGQTTLGLN